MQAAKTWITSHIRKKNTILNSIHQFSRYFQIKWWVYVENCLILFQKPFRQSSSCINGGNLSMPVQSCPSASERNLSAGPECKWVLAVDDTSSWLGAQESHCLPGLGHQYAVLYKMLMEGITAVNVFSIHRFFCVFKWNYESRYCQEVKGMVFSCSKNSCKMKFICKKGFSEGLIRSSTSGLSIFVLNYFYSNFYVFIEPK